MVRLAACTGGSTAALYCHSLLFSPNSFAILRYPADCLAAPPWHYAFAVLVCSNVLPVAIELQQDFVTESSQSALRAVFASWTLEECLDWWVLN